MKPRFTIAHILLFTAIVGLIIGGTLDRAQLNKRYQANTTSRTTVLATSKKWVEVVIHKQDTTNEIARYLMRKNTNLVVTQALQDLSAELDLIFTNATLTLSILKEIEIK